MQLHRAFVVIALGSGVFGCSSFDSPGDSGPGGVVSSSGWHQLHGSIAAPGRGIDGLKYVYAEGLIVDNDHLKLVYQTAVQSLCA